MYSGMFFCAFTHTHSFFFFQPKQLQGFQGNQELERSKKQNLPEWLWIYVSKT